MRSFRALCLLALPMPLAAQEDPGFWRVDAHLNQHIAVSAFDWTVQSQENSRMIVCNSCETDAFISIALAPFPENAKFPEDIFASYLVGRGEKCAEQMPAASPRCIFTEKTSHRFMPGYHALTRLEGDRVAYERIMVSGGVVFVYGEGPDTRSFISELEALGSTMTHAINQLY